ncbi:MAG: hypothetical protein ABR95_07020 [Sphingobacteriales bacterium BACL12 MAG-120813-bin55]|nr:MAG: hypothetical protein ABR94_09260 [Sphingobacteriales bacterium BACL12 MAG-120802-bin5]KRP11301.1 MAG: hypothetical protein ABR95_07020 [Sphingobacteriales bacterium BACL12 MAG-120813-bin55]
MALKTQKLFRYRIQRLAINQMMEYLHHNLKLLLIHIVKGNRQIRVLIQGLYGNLIIMPGKVMLAIS